MPQLTWTRSTTGEWLDLHRVNLGPVEDHGVYVIWHGGGTPRVVRVGQGNIRERLLCHRDDAAVQAYRPYTLYVTWAYATVYQVDGIERYLANELRPLVGDRWPDAVPLPVNLPWAA